MSEHARRRTVKPGETVRLELPYSEVCMHLRVAGTIRRVEVLPDGAQIMDVNGMPLSFPITHGEAGLHRDYSVKDDVVLHALVEPDVCATVDCNRLATQSMTWVDRPQFGEDREPRDVTELVCKPCGESYACRPALKARLSALPA